MIETAATRCAEVRSPMWPAVPLQSGWSDLCLQKLERAVTTVDVHKTLPKCQSPGDQGSLGRGAWPAPGWSCSRAAASRADVLQDRQRDRRRRGRGDHGEHERPVRPDPRERETRRNGERRVSSAARPAGRTESRRPDSRSRRRLHREHQHREADLGPECGLGSPASIHANPGTPELQPRRDLADHQGMSSLGSAASNRPASPAAVISARSPKVTRSLPRSAEAHRAARQRHLVARGRSPLPDGLPFQGHLGRRGPAVPRPGTAPSTPEPHRGGRRLALPPIRLRANSGARDSCSSSRAAISGRSPESITARQKNAQRGRSGRWCRRRAVSTASAPAGV